tara:strand:+ start:899 stop:1096 length:198 start_codon:yes stop_codon:yes gene_type:complete
MVCKRCGEDTTHLIDCLYFGDVEDYQRATTEESRCKDCGAPLGDDHYIGCRWLFEVTGTQCLDDD